MVEESDERFRLRLEVEKEHIDSHRHVNNVSYLLWIQEVAVAHWQVRATPEQLERYTWFVLRHEIDYKRRAFEDDSLVAETWVGEAHRMKCERYTRIYRADMTLVEAKSVWCLMNAETQRPTRVTDELRAMFKMI